MSMNLPKNAFTLIELLLVISVMTILTGAMIPSFTSYMKDQSIKQSVEQVKNDLRTIQNNVLTDSLPPEIPLTLPMYWGVLFEVNSPNYYYFHNASNSTCDGLKDETKKFVLPNSITSLDTYCIFFDFADGAASGSNYVAVKDNRTTMCVKVNSAGLISTGVWNEGSSACD